MIKKGEGERLMRQKRDRESSSGSAIAAFLFGTLALSILLVFSGGEKAAAMEEQLVVAIDPGHQGSWVDMSEEEPIGPGASETKAKSSTGTTGTYSGVPEYELNLQISKLLQTELEERGYKVVLTREDNDTAISNSERATLAWEEGGDIYVRIHANGSDDPSTNGALAMVPSSSNPYVPELADDSFLLADCILSEYCLETGFSSLGVQYYDNMSGINWSQIPVMILEMGFMTNESDDLNMEDPSIQGLMVKGIADGIDDYFSQKGMTTTKGEENVDDVGSSSSEAKNAMEGLLETLEERFLRPASQNGESWALSIASLDTGVTGQINGDEKMKSASVIKVFIMAAIYDRVCYPSSEDRQLYIEESYDGELKDLITAMITQSDNEAANTLVTALGGGDAAAGMVVVNQFLAENGYTGTSMGRLFLEENPTGDNYTTANDCLRLLKSIFEGTCVNEEASAKMYDYLKEQTKVNKIPEGLSGTSAEVANKTGELSGDYGDYVENDIAIVTDEEKTYILCILSGNLNGNNGTAISEINEISRTVYDALIAD